MAIESKQLSYDMILGSPEISNWLSQFEGAKRTTAISLLSQLRFVTRDVYSAWLIGKLNPTQFTDKSAIYAVRKFPDNQKSLWDNVGKVINRSATALGSEDLVYSLVANAVRKHKKSFLDHPSLDILKAEKIHNIILIDDSIGSGKRVSDFIESMMFSKTFKSWWSFGFIKFHIIAIARTCESEKAIVVNTCGSDHGCRKHRKSSKFQFISEIVYSKKCLENRWGTQYQDILGLCDSQTKIEKTWRRGFGEVMGNIVFYHSVPNNIPGMLFYKGNEWNPLFSERVVPLWLCSLLDNQTVQAESKSCSVSGFTASVPREIIQLLRLIKRGVRNLSSLALRMDSENIVLEEMIEKILQAGLISDRMRLTEAGLKILSQRDSKEIKSKTWNRNLYIPKSWCADQ